MERERDEDGEGRTRVSIIYEYLHTHAPFLPFIFVFDNDDDGAKMYVCFFWYPRAWAHFLRSRVLFFIAYPILHFVILSCAIMISCYEFGKRVFGDVSSEEFG